MSHNSKGFRLINIGLVRSYVEILERMSDGDGFLPRQGVSRFDQRWPSDFADAFNNDEEYQQRYVASVEQVLGLLRKELSEGEAQDAAKA